MKIKNKRTLIALLVLVIVGVIGFTLAYFSDKININNIFKTKPYGTTVTEVFTSPDNWTPGTTTDKTVIAKNTGEVDVAVRVSYTEEWQSNDGTILSGWVDKDGNVTNHEDELETDEKAAIINFANTRDWTEQNGYYYYNYKLAKNEETSTFIKSVTFNPLVQSDSNCDEKEENGTKTVTCTSTKKGYDGATYTLNIKVETVQYDQYKSAWNTDVAIAPDKNNLLYDVVESKGVKYTGNGSDSYANDVYFLTDDTNNNVLFANYCWKIVRTTETGGVKLIYNGEQKEEIELDSLSDTGLVNITNDVTYPYSYNSSTKEWTSTNHTDRATGIITFSVPESDEYIIAYKVSSESSDKMIIYIDGEKIEEISGEKSGYIDLGTVTSSNVIKIEYKKDEWDSEGNDNIIFSIGRDTGTEKKLTCNNDIDDTKLGSSEFNINFNSPAYVGYMYNKVYESKEGTATSDSLYGTDVNYVNGTYYLVNTSNSLDEAHHYTCNNTTGTCNIVRYYYYYVHSNYYYIELSGTENIQTALKEMLSNDDVNKTDSTIKSKIDDWYEENMIDYEEYLEDTVFCNDRSISSLGGWNPNGGNISSYPDYVLQFKEYNASSDLTCSNKIDRFTKEKSNGNGALKYSVGLLSSPEANLWGENARNNDSWYWLISPTDFAISASMNTIDGNDFDNMNAYYSFIVVRPSISLKPSTKYTSGDGTTNDPFIIPTE